MCFDSDAPRCFQRFGCDQDQFRAEVDDVARKPRRLIQNAAATASNASKASTV